uniref:Uncharacterized protein n=1 Tax=Lepeophtheirus salmonis TaxID=72036 RepID=A0A0K2TN22_LEPSM
MIKKIIQYTRKTISIRSIGSLVSYNSNPHIRMQPYVITILSIQIIDMRCLLSPTTLRNRGNRLTWIQK